MTKRLEFAYTTGESNVIPPLIYLSLVENAFKHGAGKMSEGAEIYIDIKQLRNSPFELKIHVQILKVMLAG